MDLLAFFTDGIWTFRRPHSIEGLDMEIEEAEAVQMEIAPVLEIEMLVEWED